MRVVPWILLAILNESSAMSGNRDKSGDIRWWRWHAKRFDPVWGGSPS
jgi:hypothetical protein